MPGRVRLATLLVWAVASLIGVSALPGGSGAAVGGTPSTSSAAFDRSVGQDDCRLAGRAYVGSRGCSRTRCVAGAKLFNPNPGAELCASRKGSHPYGAYVDARLCTSLGRVFIDSLNYCASNPEREYATLPAAPQCRDRSLIYVDLAETEGHYDECLPPDQVYALTGVAAATGTTLASEVDRRSVVQCPTRPGRVLVDGICELSGQPAPAATDQVLMIGDSVGWRSSDELGAKRPTFAIDAVPARKIGELDSRLDDYRAVHGQPSGLIVELGTNASPGYSRRDLRRSIGSLPATTQVLFVLPYRTTPGAGAPTYGRWMRDLARGRDRTCVLDWPSEVRERRGLLLDDLHPTSRGEQVYAGLVSRAWTRC